MQMSFAAARQHMIDSQIRTNKVIDDRLLEALRELPREAFVPDNVKVRAYVDDDLPLGNGRYLTEPMVVARLLQSADVKPTDMVLVAAAGTGYAAGLLSKLANTVVAVEADHALSERAAAALQQQAADNVVWQEGDPAAGFAKHAPYDVILIDGGVEIVPAALLEQLAEGGRLVTVLFEGRVGRAVLMMKERGSVSRRVLFDANIPLLSAFAKPAEFSF
ncbi:protein-L-isoaspartate O-methyltransferase [Dongia soli]|uniref:Protein-L-isoaspartate O-methyltransferase n=1 Tax=Dongia soli TaxID=600628 RepID=A0ABU5EF92_9PROT|nr:protein-L-isoaspartate O-methyltransferase [Dongia soli]MDY0885074.1 protein-L-isoaspartate O-methyltransferase [Dongia soli]